MAQRTIDQDVGGDPHHNPDSGFLNPDCDPHAGILKSILHLLLCFVQAAKHIARQSSAQVRALHNALSSYYRPTFFLATTPRVSKKH